MKILRTYSSVENSDRPMDVLINTENEPLECVSVVKGKYEGRDVFGVRINTKHAQLKEIHPTEEFARQRVNEILVAFGTDLEEAAKLSKDIQFAND